MLLVDRFAQRFAWSELNQLFFRNLDRLAGVGIKQPNVSAMEKGERPIGKNLAKKLGELFNVSYKVFL